jgi:hypothetical protein
MEQTKQTANQCGDIPAGKVEVGSATAAAAADGGKG